MSHFISSDSGAVTVDWVVLTAGLVGLGLATTGVVSSGVEDLSGDTAAEMQSNTNVAASFAARNQPAFYAAAMTAEEYGYTFRRGQSGGTWFEKRMDYITTAEDDSLASWHANISDQISDYDTIEANLAALDPDTATLAEIGAAMSTSNVWSSWDEANAQASIDGGYYGGIAPYGYAQTTAGYLHWAQTFTATKVAEYDALEAEMAKRGI